MKSIVKSLFIFVALIALLACVVVPGNAYVPPGWQKITGKTSNYSGVPDGIMGTEGDRQNSYAWSMEFHGGYLYLGTSRNIVGAVLSRFMTPGPNWPTDVPIPSDMQSRIYRMKLADKNCKWEQFYIADPSIRDMGYRMMKTYTAPYSTAVLYVGSFGYPHCRMMAIDSKQKQPVEIFNTDGMSVRAISEYNKQLFWASEVTSPVGLYPKIWYSTDPLTDFKKHKAFGEIEVPANWFPKGAEILDLVPFNGYLYVFFCDHNWDGNKGGFWCAKLKKSGKVWQWTLIVGDKNVITDPKLKPKYDPGMGRSENGGATPFIFKDKMYVGTISKTMWRFLLTGEAPDNIPPTGTQIFRFDAYDKWERVVPPAVVTNPDMVSLFNGFANPLNLYLWRFAIQNGRLYAGTFDARTVLDPFISDIIGETDTAIPLWNPSGFDLYSTADGITWWPESLDGFSDKFNYGARTLMTEPKSGDLYLGTANPFYGCQVWRKKATTAPPKYYPDPPYPNGYWDMAD